jgi:hypothetical protein
VKFDDLMPVLDVALAPTSLKDITQLERALRDNGWTLNSTEPVETGEERRWSAPGAPRPTTPSPAAWTTGVPDRGVSFGLIIGTATDGDAEQLRTQLQERIDSSENFRLVNADDVWTIWSDGNHDAHLAIHRSAMLSGKEVVPSVQLGVEPAERSSTPGD